MSLVDRCIGCDELVTRCRCGHDALERLRAGRDAPEQDAEAYAATQRRFRERGGLWL